MSTNGYDQSFQAGGGFTAEGCGTRPMDKADLAAAQLDTFRPEESDKFAHSVVKVATGLKIGEILEDYYPFTPIQGEQLKQVRQAMATRDTRQPSTPATAPQRERSGARASSKGREARTAPK